MGNVQMTTNLCNEERPFNFDQVVGQTAVVENIRQQSIRDKFFQVYILEGQFGSGKTTMARIISRAVNCQHRDENGNPCGECETCKGSGSMDVIEIDAASNTGVDNIREIIESVSYLPSEGMKKVYIIDEVHKLSDGAFNALLKVLEEPPKHVVFILCTTEARKIPATIRSRAACYHFNRISVSDIGAHMTDVAKKHGLKYTHEGVMSVARNASGSMRNALRLLEQAAQADEGVTEKTVASMLGLSDPTELFGLLGVLVDMDVASAIKQVQALIQKGKEPMVMVRDLMAICTDCVLASVSGLQSINNTEQYISLLGDMITKAGTDTFCSITESLMSISDDLKRMDDETTLVCGIIKMSVSKESAIARLESRIKALEKAVADGAVRATEETVAQNPIVTEVSSEPVVTPSSSNGYSFHFEKKDRVAEPDETESVPFPEVKEVEPEEVAEETTAEEPTEEIPAEEEEKAKPENKASSIDAFDLFSMFSFGGASSTPKENSEPTPIVTVEETETVVDTAEEIVTPEVSSDSTVTETVEVTEYIGTGGTAVEVQNFLDELLEGDPFAENLFMLCFEQSVEGDMVVFTTDRMEFFRMAVAYRDRSESFPFTIRVK